MAYKTILVHVDESAHASARIAIAAAIARTQDAHLIGTAVTGASRYLAQTRMLADLAANLHNHLDFLRQRAQRGLEDFEASAQKLGLSSFEKRLVDDEAGSGICLQARYADLIVIGQHDPHEISPVTMPDFPQYVVLNAGRPVLLVPYAGKRCNIGNRVLIAWNGSMEATRAMTDAIPLLKRAAMIDALEFNARAQKQDPQRAGDMAWYLARHGIKVNIMHRRTEQEAGAALLSAARELGSDLIVMGGYGHSRFREILLGGVTNTVLEEMAVPVLMSH